MVHSRSIRERLAAARLYVLVDGRSSRDAMTLLAKSLLAAGADVLQLRDKTLDDRSLLDRARLLRELTRAADKLLIINDRPDIAMLAQADGVHVGQQDLQVADARAIIDAEAVVGVSTHCLAQARQAVTDGADYLGCGPAFASSTKQFDQYPGLALLRAVRREISLPAFAIGGISERNLPQVLETGFRRIAVSAAVIQAEDPSTAARRLLEMLHGAPGDGL